MNKKVIIILLVCGILLIGGGFLSYILVNKDDTNTNTSTKKDDKLEIAYKYLEENVGVKKEDAKFVSSKDNLYTFSYNYYSIDYNVEIDVDTGHYSLSGERLIGGGEE